MENLLVNPKVAVTNDVINLKDLEFFPYVTVFIYPEVRPGVDHFHYPNTIPIKFGGNPLSPLKNVFLGNQKISLAAFNVKKTDDGNIVAYTVADPDAVFFGSPNDLRSKYDNAFAQQRFSAYLTDANSSELLFAALNEVEIPYIAIKADVDVVDPACSLYMQILDAPFSIVEKLEMLASRPDLIATPILKDSGKHIRYLNRIDQYAEIPNTYFFGGETLRTKGAKRCIYAMRQKFPKCTIVRFSIIDIKDHAKPQLEIDQDDAVSIHGRGITTATFPTISVIDSLHHASHAKEF